IVVGIWRDQIRRLRQSGIATTQALSSSTEPVEGIGETALERIRSQARLQVQAATTGERAYSLVDEPAPGVGLAALPAPSRGDLFFDIEGDPYVLDGGLEYLFGVAGPDGYRAWWAHDRAAEKVAFEEFVD